MAPTDITMNDSSVPAPTAPVPAPRVLDAARDLRAERDAEAARDKAEAAAKTSRFQARKMTPMDKPTRTGPEYEAYMFETAANNPFMSLKDTSPSTYIPNLAGIMYLLMYMDHMMANTKRFTDNCAGWCPPVSQMYISVLLYVQIMRAMDAAGLIGPGSELSIFLGTFNNIFPLNDLWIPGPLVAAFRNISAFWPSSSDQFGNVSPTLPSTPGWSQATHYNPRFTAAAAEQAALSFLFPNISAFISRMRAICTVAMTAGTTQATFSTHMDGPLNVQHLFQNQVANNANTQQVLTSPGMAFAYPDNLQLWINAGYRIEANSIPQDLDVAQDAVSNDWTSFLRFDNNNHVWFGNAAAIMAKYCQYFNGSAPLGEIMPNASASGAVKLRMTNASSLFNNPTWHAAAAGLPAVAAHFSLRNNARIVLNARIAVQDVPSAHVYAAVTYALNAYSAQAVQNAYRIGRFWNLGPDTDGRENIEVLPGTLTTIMRRYHSDVRIAADKQ